MLKKTGAEGGREEERKLVGMSGRAGELLGTLPPPLPISRAALCASDDLLDAGPLEAAMAALLLHLAGRAVPCAGTAGVTRSRRQLHVLLIDT